MFDDLTCKVIWIKLDNLRVQTCHAIPGFSNFYKHVHIVITEYAPEIYTELS